MLLPVLRTPGVAEGVILGCAGRVVASVAPGIRERGPRGRVRPARTAWRGPARGRAETVRGRVTGPRGRGPARHVESLKAENERAVRKLRELETRMVDLKADADGWKRRHDDSARRAAEHQDAAARAAARAARAEGRAEELQARGDALMTEMKELRARLQDAHRVAG